MGTELKGLIIPITSKGKRCKLFIGNILEHILFIEEAEENQVILHLDYQYHSVIYIDGGLDDFMKQLMAAVRSTKKSK